MRLNYFCPILQKKNRCGILNINILRCLPNNAPQEDKKIKELFQAITLAKCVLTSLELNWNQRFSGKKTKLNICHHMLTSSTQLQNRSFHVVERTRTSAKCLKIKVHVQSVQKCCFSLPNMQICDVLVAVLLVVP